MDMPHELLRSTVIYIFRTHCICKYSGHCGCTR